MTQARLMQHLPLALLLAACAEPSAIAPCLDLAEVQRYGVMDDSESDNAAPGVLGDIRGIVPGPNGDVFVLDRSSHRVVAFDSTGAARVVAGRSGEGPGEFILPMHLTTTGRGVSVPDYELRRISTSSGLAVIGDSLVLQGTFSYPRPFDWNDPPARDEGVLSLDVYRADGRHVTNLPIPSGAVTNALTSDPVTGRIFLPVNQPFPQVVEYTLEKCQQPRSTATSSQQ